MCAGVEMRSRVLSEPSAELTDDVEVLRFGIEPIQDGLGVLGQVSAPIALTHEALDAVEALEPDDRGELNLSFDDIVRETRRSDATTP